MLNVISYLRRILQLLPEGHEMRPTFTSALETMKKEYAAFHPRRKKRVLVFSNVRSSEDARLQTRPDDVLVFINKAVPAAYYKETAADAKILYRRSDKEEYGSPVEFLDDRLVYGEGGIPKEFLDSIKKEYDWDYYIEPGKTRCATTGFMVVKYMEHLYPDREVVLVNFGYDVKCSTYRCPWHNWKYEAEQLKKFKHLYTTEKVTSSGDGKKRLYYELSGWLGDNVYGSAVIENIVNSGKFLVNVETTHKVLWENCPHIDRSITRENADLIVRQRNLYNWENDTPHIIEGVTARVSHDTGVEIPVVTRIPKVYMELPSERLIDKPYVLINTGWQGSAETKKWARSYWLQLLDSCPDLTFVQFGQKRNHATPLPGAINMIDKTSIQDLARLVRDAACVISPPSGVIHLAAAFGTPFISLAGGREPASLVNYPGGVVLSSCGQLECCQKGGCHRNHFTGEKCCADPVQCPGDTIPTGKCMTLITPEEVKQNLVKILQERQ